MVIFPSDTINFELYQKYRSNQEVGFCEAKIAAEAQQQKRVMLNQVFPKLAALAGYGKKKKDCGTVPKGWMTYKNKTLRICTGNPLPHRGNAPKYTAWDGIDRHEPDSPDSILCEMQVEIQSLHHLFCTAEGLLHSL